MSAISINFLLVAHGGGYPIFLIYRWLLQQ